MKVALFSDIHANWHALEAVMHDCPRVDETICLGDVVGYGGEPKRCLDEVRKRGWLTLVGNHDRACTDPNILEWFNEDAASVVRWTIDELGDDRLDWLRQLPDFAERFAVQLVHASPRDHIYEYILDTEVAAANLELIGATVCFHGHTHVPGIFKLVDRQVQHEYQVIDFKVAGPCLVNPGSVGQPRDGIPMASYAIWDVDGASVEFRRVRYDIRAAQKAIRKAGLPERFALRLEAGR